MYYKTVNWNVEFFIWKFENIYFQWIYSLNELKIKYEVTKLLIKVATNEGHEMAKPLSN